jgi:hypothetical protein
MLNTHHFLKSDRGTAGASVSSFSATRRAFASDLLPSPVALATCAQGEGSPPHAAATPSQRRLSSASSLSPPTRPAPGRGLVQAEHLALGWGLMPTPASASCLRRLGFPCPSPSPPSPSSSSGGPHTSRPRGPPPPSPPPTPAGPIPAPTSPAFRAPR